MENTTTLLTQIKQTSGLTEAELAVRIGVSQPTINRILHGADTSAKNLLKIMAFHKQVHEQRT